MDQIVFEPFYDVLRTKEQLGYGVASGMRMTNGVYAFCFTIESAAYGPRHMDARVEAFIVAFRCGWE